MDGMPRRPREEVEGGVHHVYARGNDKRAIYLDDDDRAKYLALLGRVVGLTRWRCLAYCLMDNHVHLLIETPEANLGRGMQRLHGLYARAFNDRHGRSGHLFQGRYGGVRSVTDAQLWATVAYVALNPVEAGLCAEAEDWHWGSHAAIVEGRAPDWLDVPRLLSYFDALGGQPRQRYLDLIGIRAGAADLEREGASAPEPAPRRRPRLSPRATARAANPRAWSRTTGRSP
jgi:putative transposase